MRPSTRRRPTTKPSVAQIYRPKETPRPQASQQTRSRQNPRPQALSHHQALPQAPRQHQQQLHVAHHSYNKHDGLHEGTRTPRHQSQRRQATPLANTHATAHRPAARSSPQTKPPAQQRIPPASSRYSPRTSLHAISQPIQKGPAPLWHRPLRFAITVSFTAPAPSSARTRDGG